jgi:phage N-6-adenine-methyltransferase
VNSALMFSKASDEWETPQDVFDSLAREFYFEIDAAANSQNAKCNRWFGPGGIHDDALQLVEWGRPFAGSVVWLNPPYSRCAEFIAKSAEQARKGNLVVALIPSRTDTRYWHDHVWDRERHKPKDGVEVRFIKGRLKFGGSKNSAPFPSAVVIFRPPASA